MGIMKPRVALRDFKLLAAKEPANRDAALKLSECEKIVRRIQFEKAIESESPPSAWEGFDPDDLGIALPARSGWRVDVEEEYDAYKLGKKMTREFIDDMIIRFKESKRIHKKYVRPASMGALTSDFPNIVGS
jgi:serine/threonine-protein phosphatase 5